MAASARMSSCKRGRTSVLSYGESEGKTHVVLLNSRNAGSRVEVVEGVVGPEDRAHTESVGDVTDTV